jgi:hypothetical protein
VKMQLKLDKKTVQAFFLEHTEKIVFGLVLLCFLYFAYDSVTRKGYPDQPKALQDSVENANNHIKQPHEVKLPYDDVSVIVKESRKWIDDKPFGFAAALEERAFKPTTLRGMPQALPVQKLLAQGGRGALPDKKGTRGQRWVVLVGLVPVKEQKEEFRMRLGNATYRDPKRDVPEYSGFLVQRAEVAPYESEPTNWDNKEMKGYYYIYRGGPREAKKSGGPDSTSDKFIEEGCCLPLPKRADGGWGAEIVHPELTKPEKTAEEPKAEEKTEPSNPIDPSAEPEKAAPKEPAAAPKEEEPEYRLFRFVDTDVKPGKQYRYRVFLLLKNPNRDLESKYLEDPDFATPVYIGQHTGADKPVYTPNSPATLNTGTVKNVKIDDKYAKWSEPSAVARVPEDVQLLLTGVARPTRPGGETSVITWIARWLEKSGTKASKEFSLFKGKVADFSGTKPVDYLTGETLVDIAGGEPLPGEKDEKGKKPAVRSGQVLVLNKAGHLVIHEEVQDEEALGDFRKESDSATGPKPPPRPPTGKGTGRKTTTKAAGPIDDEYSYPGRKKK